jgi:hypothetical protein
MAGERIRARFTFEEDNETVATVVVERWVPKSDQLEQRKRTKRGSDNYGEELMPK